MAEVNPNVFQPVPSLRHGQNSVWCDQRGRYCVDNVNATGAFFFHVKRRNGAGGSIDLRCKSAKAGCAVSAKIRQNGEALTVTGCHNHLPDTGGHGSAFRSAKSNWLTAVEQNPRSSPMDVVLAERRKMTFEAACQVVPARQTRTVRHHAAQGRPPAVLSLLELHEAIAVTDLPGFTITRYGHPLLSYFEPERNLVVLTTLRTLQLLNSADMMHADATYKVVPHKLCKQLFTIHANWGGHVGLVACALMNTFDTDSYRWVFQRLKQVLPELNINFYMGDWDPAMRAAVRMEFPGVHIFGCLFHYAQCLLKRASESEVGLARETRRPGEVMKKFLALTALPLLPAAEILPAFEHFSQRAVAVHQNFTPLIAYIRSHWMERITPERLSVYRALARTNNAREWGRPRSSGS